jgi:hypothetical protein
MLMTMMMGAGWEGSLRQVFLPLAEFRDSSFGFFFSSVPGV